MENKTKQAKKPEEEHHIKVVYISTPLRLTASGAAEFRSLVQKFTGRDSNVAEMRRSPVAVAPVNGGGGGEVYFKGLGGEFEMLEDLVASQFYEHELWNKKLYEIYS